MESCFARLISQSRKSPVSGNGLYPSILGGAALPVSRCRRTHLIALLSKTPDRAAAPGDDIRSFNNAAKIR